MDVVCSARSWSWGCEQSERRSSKEEKNAKIQVQPNWRSGQIV
jgi:hypothetical protein